MILPADSYRRAAFLLCAALLVCAPVAMAQNAPGRDTVERLEKKRDQARSKSTQLRQQAKNVQADIADVQRQLVELGAALQRQREDEATAREALDALAGDEKRQLAGLARQQAALMDVMAAIERAEMNHPPALAVSPDDAVKAARAALLLGSVVPELKTRSDALAASLQKLKTTRAQMAQQKQQLKIKTDALNTSLTRLQTLLAKRQKLERDLRGNARIAAANADKYAQQASTLRDIIRRLELTASQLTPRRKPQKGGTHHPLTPRRKPQKTDLPPLDPFAAPTTRFSDSKGLLPHPVPGPVTSRFGQAKDKLKKTGIIFSTRASAQVLAPYDGQIVYSGVLTGYNHVLILNVGNGYLIIIAGLDRPYVVNKQVVLAGEPIGQMSNRRRPPPEFYLEFQKDGRSIDPLPWLARAGGGQ